MEKESRHYTYAPELRHFQSVVVIQMPPFVAIYRFQPVRRIRLAFAQRIKSHLSGLIRCNWEQVSVLF